MMATYLSVHIKINMKISDDQEILLLGVGEKAQ